MQRRFVAGTAVYQSQYDSFATCHDAGFMTNTVAELNGSASTIKYSSKSAVSSGSCK